MEPMGMLLSAVQLERLEGMTQTYDDVHILRFCSESLDQFSLEVGVHRINNLMALMPEMPQTKNSSAIAARTSYATHIVRELSGYGLDINQPLSGSEVRQGKAIIKLLMAFPLHRDTLMPSSPDSDKALISYIASHTDNVDDIIDAVKENDELLDAEYLEGYLDKTAPSLRDGFL